MVGLPPASNSFPQKHSMDVACKAADDCNDRSHLHRYRGGAPLVPDVFSALNQGLAGT